MFATAGIPCLNITGYANSAGIKNTSYSSGNHEWNAVYMNGKWYLLDITWDSINRYYGDSDSRNVLGQTPKYVYYGIPSVLFSTNHCSMEVNDFSDATGISVGYNPSTTFNVGSQFSFGG